MVSHFHHIRTLPLQRWATVSDVMSQDVIYTAPLPLRFANPRQPSPTLVNLRQGARERRYRKRCTRTLATSPIATNATMVEDPPYDMNGSGIPVTGIIPSVIPMFSKI